MPKNLRLLVTFKNKNHSLCSLLQHALTNSNKRNLVWHVPILLLLTLFTFKTNKQPIFADTNFLFSEPDYLLISPDIIEKNGNLCSEMDSISSLFLPLCVINFYFFDDLLVNQLTTNEQFLSFLPLCKFESVLEIPFHVHFINPFSFF